MIRQPTPVDEQLRWWRQALLIGPKQPEDIGGFDDPQCGFYKRRLKWQSKIWLPAQITLNQQIDWLSGELMEPETYRLQIYFPNRTMTITDQYEVWDRWLKLTPIDLEEWNWIKARLAVQLLGT